MALRDGEREMLELLSGGLSDVVKRIGTVTGQAHLVTAGKMLKNVSDDLIARQLIETLANMRTDEFDADTGSLTIIDERPDGGPLVETE